jgi:hypothetical protein
MVHNEETVSEGTISKQILDLCGPEEVRFLPVPHLAPYLVGLCSRYLEFEDDIAMIAAEQLVDGMDIDQDWCTNHLKGANSNVCQLVARLVAGKESRLDDFNGNKITCFIADEAEAESVKLIPGYD